MIAALEDDFCTRFDHHDFAGAFADLTPAYQQQVGSPSNLPTAAGDSWAAYSLRPPAASGRWPTSPPPCARRWSWSGCASGCWRWWRRRCSQRTPPSGCARLTGPGPRAAPTPPSPPSPTRRVRASSRDRQRHGAPGQFARGPGRRGHVAHGRASDTALSPTCNRTAGRVCR
jgi:hypothetical protein